MCWASWFIQQQDMVLRSSSKSFSIPLLEEWYLILTRTTQLCQSLLRGILVMTRLQITLKKQQRGKVFWSAVEETITTIHLPFLSFPQFVLSLAVWSAKSFLSFKLPFIYSCTMKRSANKSSPWKKMTVAKEQTPNTQLHLAYKYNNC